MDAPLRMQTESYEAFSQRLLNLGQESESQASIESELRRLDIDPTVFYGNARRLGLNRFDADDHDPVAAASAPKAASAPNAASASLFCAAAIAQAAEAADDDRVVGGTWAETTDQGARLSPATRQSLMCSEEEEETLASKAAPDLNVPRHASDEDYEEVLDAGMGETRGGRWGHETPHDLGARLQVDSLTDDGDEDDLFREEVICGADATAEEGEEDGEGDAIEAFSLDPDFDYDNVHNLASRVG